MPGVLRWESGTAMKPAADSFSTNDLITLVVAIVGAVTGLLSFFWAIISRYLDRPRLQIDLRAGFLTPNGAVTFPLPDATGYTRPPDSQPLLVVDVQNGGTLPMSISSWVIDIGPTQLADPPDFGYRKPLPHRLEGHDAVQFVAGAENVARIGSVVKRSTGAPKKSLGVGQLRATVHPAVGKKVYSPVYDLQQLEAFIEGKKAGTSGRR